MPAGGWWCFANGIIYGFETFYRKSEFFLQKFTVNVDSEIRPIYKISKILREVLVGFAYANTLEGSFEFLHTNFKARDLKGRQ